MDLDRTDAAALRALLESQGWALVCARMRGAMNDIDKTLRTEADHGNFRYLQGFYAGLSIVPDMPEEMLRSISPH